MPTTIELQHRRFLLMAAEHAALIGSRIREAREEKHWSQRELADAIPGKADLTQVSRWERGINRVSDDTLTHIAEQLGKPLAWFHSSPANGAETPNPFDAEPTQLDRIEGLLTELLERLAASDVRQAVARDSRPEQQSPPGARRRRAS